MNTTERRANTRLPCRLLVQHQSQADDAGEVDYATNLSRTGLFLATGKPLSPGTTLHVRFSPRRDTRLVSAFCRVTRVAADGVGAEFVGLDAESASALDAFLHA